MKYIHSISATNDKGPVTNQIAGALVQRIIRAQQASEKFKVRRCSIRIQSHNYNIVPLGRCRYPRSARVCRQCQGRIVREDHHGRPIQDDEQRWYEYLRGVKKSWDRAVSGLLSPIGSCGTEIFVIALTTSVSIICVHTIVSTHRTVCDIPREI